MRVADAVVKTIVVTDLVDSTALLEKLGDERASLVFARCDRAARNRLADFGGQEIDKTDGFLLLFDRPIDACRYVIAYHSNLAELSAEMGLDLFARAGIHLGEVFLRQNSPEDVARGAKPIEVEGLAKPTVARLASLAQGRQTLLTRSAFELARRAAVGETLSDKPIQWLAHGPYLFKGVDEPVEIFEVGLVGFAPLSVPPNSEKARRVVRAGDETMLGWRPAPGQEIPHRANWIVREKVSEGGFGEAWLAAHKKTGDKRVFKFCFQADRLRSLRREVMLFRLMKEALGNRDDIARVLDWQFDEPPYFLESEYTAGGNFSQFAEDQGGLGRIPLATRLELIAQTAVALSAAHSAGVLHKDIRPANILIETDRQGLPKARLSEFGIGLVQNEAQLVEKGITVYGFPAMPPEGEAAAGTRMYMAPELIDGKAASVQSDLYALGVMLYQAVVGDFGRALTSTWDRDIQDDLLREDIAALVDGSPARRLANAAEIAARLRTLERRRVSRHALPMGGKFGSYTILRQIGAGAMGAVYLAEDSRLGRKVALKFLSPEFAGDDERMRRFMQEAKAASALNHPNIVTVYEAGTLGAPFIATEFVDGRTVREHLESGGIPLAQALDIAVQLTGAIAAAHQAGIIHRDIKPENVMLRADGYVKLLDFGVAKLADASSPAGDALHPMGTQEGMVIGTLSYMSPEQARGSEVDRRTDIFAIGALIYETVTGHCAFGGDTASDRMASILKTDPPPMSAYAPATPDSLARVVSKAIRKNKEERYATAEELLADLKEIQRDLALRGKPQPKAKSRTVWIAAMVALMAVAAIAVVPRLARRAPDEPAGPASIAAAVPPVALSYWITVQKYRDGKPFEEPFRLAREINFEQDYRIRMHFTFPRPGFLYLVSEAPDNARNGSAYNLIAAAPMDANQEKQVPEQSWFQFDGEKGSEKVWIVWSGKSVPELEVGTKFINTKDQGTINDAGIRDTVQAFLKSHASQTELDKDDSSQLTRVRARADPVVYLLRLEHH